MSVYQRNVAMGADKLTYKRQMLSSRDILVTVPPPQEQEALLFATPIVLSYVRPPKVYSKPKNVLPDGVHRSVQHRHV
jgi:hypothetical protein